MTFYEDMEFCGRAESTAQNLCEIAGPLAELIGQIATECADICSKAIPTYKSCPNQPLLLESNLELLLALENKS